MCCINLSHNMCLDRVSVKLIYSQPDQLLVNPYLSCNPPQLGEDILFLPYQSVRVSAVKQFATETSNDVWSTILVNIT